MQTERKLKQKIEKLTKINEALMSRVERSTDQQGNAYSLFTTAIALEGQVHQRTDELKAALTSLEQTNDALIQARDAAERANEVKTRFFTAVGHDLLQPLHAARLSLSALDESDEISQHRKLATQIDHALCSIEDLLRTILDLSKLETGVIKPSPKPVRLREIFDSLRLDFAPIVYNKGLTLQAESHGLTVSSDPLLLRRILQNLMANAVRYTERGHISLTAHRSGKNVDITVGDTGPGIPEDEAESIFEEFQRGSAGSKENHNGFGLGLSIVQRMAKALDHPITLDSKVSEGSRFTVTAQHVDAVGEPTTDSAGESGVHAPYGFTNIKIIVIDNDLPVLEAMQTLLGQWFCKTCMVRHLSEVQQLIDDPPFQPDIILADYHLDNNDCGLTAIEKIRNQLGNDLPAIVITADHAPATAQSIEEAGCEILRKPVRPAALRALISHLLG